MSKLHWLLACLLSCLASRAAEVAEPPAATAPPGPELEIRAQSQEGELEYDERTGVISDPAGVLVTYGDSEVSARAIRLNRESGEVEAEGQVRLRRGNEVWSGERIRYNFLTRQMQAHDFRAGLAPFYAAGQGLSGNLTNQNHSATNAVLTTDNYAEPGYYVKARRITFVPGHYIEARGATLYLGKVPILYLPKYRRHLDRHPNNFVFLPGYRSLYGPYLLSTYNWSIATNATASFHLDYRVKRGVATGADLRYDLDELGAGDFKSYYAWDQDPGEDPNGVPIRDDRYRIGFMHSAFLRTNLSAKAVVGFQSDAYLTHDFFEDEYRKDVQPKTFVEFDQAWPNWDLNVLAMPQVNDFFQTVERLPDLKLSGVRQQLGISPFYYESETSAGYFRLNYADDAEPSYAALRTDTYHQLLVPQTFFGAVHLTPRVGGRYTYYGEEDGTGSTFDAQDRWVFNTGAEISTKASRIWRNARSGWLEVDGLRHIVEPSVNYVYVPTPNREPRQLPQFDSELYSLELLPVDFPDYNNIDSVDSQNVFRLGLRNKLQTKREDGVDNLVNWAAFLDWRARPRPDQRTWGDFYSDLDFRPRSWLTFNSELRYDFNTTTWNMANHTATLEPSDRWAWKVGHRYLREVEELGPDSDNNTILSSLVLRLNENWGLRFRHHFEARDGTMEEQYYTIYRDFRSWTGALTFRFRDDRGGRPEDFTVAVTFSLKAFPRFKLGYDRDEPELLIGG